MVGIGELSSGSVHAQLIPARDLISQYLNGDVERVYHPWLRRTIDQLSEATK